MIPAKAVLVTAALVAGGSTAIVLGAKQSKHEATIPAGTTIVAELQSEISTKSDQPGQLVELHTFDPIPIDHQTQIPAGVIVRGEVTAAQGGGRMAGAPQLGLRFTELEVDGRSYAIQAKSFLVTGKSDAGESAAQIGGGAIAGGILGGILGDGGDAVKGAVAGAVIGTGVAVATDGDDLQLRAGQKLRVQLAEAITVQYRPAGNEEAKE